MATLETSLEANYDRRTLDGQADKATYRGTSYRSAQKYKNYENALSILNSENLENRRKIWTKRFATNGIMTNTLTYLFPIKNKEHEMKRRKNETYKVNFAHMERLKNASIITMQKSLNP